MDRCIKCHQKGHFIKNCPQINGKQSKLLCSRCGRNTHNEDKCYAITHLSGENLIKDPNEKKTRSGKKWGEEDEDKLRKLIAEGKSCKDIASELERSEKAIKMRCQKLSLII